MQVEAIAPPSDVAPLSVCAVSWLAPLTHAESVTINNAFAQLSLEGAWDNAEIEKKRGRMKSGFLIIIGFASKVIGCLKIV